MSRKGTNIYKRKDGRWEARYIKTVDAFGKKHYGYVYGMTYLEAREKQLNNLQNKSTQCDKRITLSSASKEWLSIIENTVKRSSFQKYKSIVNNHLLPHSIAALPIKNITRLMYNEFANSKLEAGFLSEKTINDIITVLGMILSYVEDNYHIEKPKLPHIKEPNKEIRVLSICEQAELEKYLCSNLEPYRFGVLLTLYTGIRLGELCALKWEDISNNSIKISKTLHRIKDGDKTIIEVTEPKTKTSNRVIPLPEFIQQYVSQLRGHGYIMTTRSGKPVEPRLMQMTFAKMIEECKLQRVCFHALRHTFATRCIEAGFDIKSLSEILGHTDVKTTLNKYVHSSFEQKQRNMELLRPIELV